MTRTRPRYRTPVASLITIRPLDSSKVALTGDLSSIFGIELFEPIAKPAPIASIAEGFMSRTRRAEVQPEHSAPRKPLPTLAMLALHRSPGDSSPAPASARTSSASTRWNAQEDDDLRREWGALPLDEIAERHGRTGNGIWCRARTLALAEPAGGWDSRDASRPAKQQPTLPATSTLAPLGIRPAKQQPTRPAAQAPLAPLTIRPAKQQPTHRY